MGAAEIKEFYAAEVTLLNRIQSYEKTSLCCKYGQLLTVECRHNLKVLNVIVDLGRNVKTPLADECLALFQGREAGNAVVAMAATDREEFIGEMHGLGKEREYDSRIN